MTDPAGRVLLLEPTYKDNWEPPGGAVDPGETPRQALERELFEELGVALPIGRLLVVDATSRAEEPGRAMLQFVFSGPVLDPATAFCHPADEIRSSRFVEAVELPALCGPRVGPRLLAALTVQQASGPSYLENAVRVG